MIYKYEIIYDPDRHCKYVVYRNNEYLDSLGTKWGAKRTIKRDIRKKRRGKKRLVVFEKVYDDTDYYA